MLRPGSRRASGGAQRFVQCPQKTLHVLRRVVPVNRHAHAARVVHYVDAVRVQVFVDPLGIGMAERENAGD
jgi:hypothetical protein